MRSLVRWTVAVWTAQLIWLGACGTETDVRTPTELQKISGDGQTGPVGETLTMPLVVQVSDELGDPVPAVTIVFTVSEGEGSVGTSSATTGADGRASTSFTAGTSVGLAKVSATIASTTISVSFTVTITGFNITLRFLGTPTTAQQQAFTSARLRWEGVITGDLPNVRLTAPASTCDADSPAVNEIVDDVLILVKLEPIDGPGGTIGKSASCYIRNPGDLPVMGTMRFDNADLDAIEADGLLPAVIVHEMGHVLGFGTVWDVLGLLADPSLSGGTDPHFTGAQAINAFDAVGGSLYAQGAKVPVENTGGAGNADSHWRESVFDNELMTGFVDAGQNPLSIVTVASFADLGYNVNLSGADSYMLGASLRISGATRRLNLADDILRVPIKRVDRNGRVVGVLQR